MDPNTQRVIVGMEEEEPAQDFPLSRIHIEFCVGVACCLATRPEADWPLPLTRLQPDYTLVTFSFSLSESRRPLNSWHFTGGMKQSLVDTKTHTHTHTHRSHYFNEW